MDEKIANLKAGIKHMKQLVTPQLKGQLPFAEAELRLEDQRPRLCLPPSWFRLALSQALLLLASRQRSGLLNILFPHFSRSDRPRNRRQRKYRLNKRQ